MRVRFDDLVIPVLVDADVVSSIRYDIFRTLYWDVKKSSLLWSIVDKTIVNNRIKERNK